MIKCIQKIALNLYSLGKYHQTHKAFLTENLKAWDRDFHKLNLETAEHELVEAKTSAREAMNFFFRELRKYNYI